jgi:hypothetical protein
MTRVRRVGMLLAIGAFAGVGCRPQSGEVPPESAPPSPPFAGTAIEEVDRAAVLAYARAQNFVPISGDSQRLMLGTKCPESCRYGPLARIDPVAGSYLLDSGQLAEGRILARVVNADTIGYPKFNLGPRDTVYWWIDRHPGGYRSVLISSRPDAKLAYDSLRIHPYPDRAAGWQWKQAQARFLWRDQDEALWIACAVSQCCRTDEEIM